MQLDQVQTANGLVIRLREITAALDRLESGQTGAVIQIEITRERHNAARLTTIRDEEGRMMAVAYLQWRATQLKDELRALGVNVE